MTDTPDTTVSYRKLWIGLALVLVIGFGILGFTGREVYRQAPPLPGEVVAEDGSLLMTREGILDGQQAWQSAGGQQIGSIWGHGAYQAPDWTADWLHRECTTLLDIWSRREKGLAFDDLDPEGQALLERRLREEMRTNRFDADGDRLVLSADRIAAVRLTAAHYRGLFSDAYEFRELREAYAMQEGVLRDPERLERLTDIHEATGQCPAEGWVAALDQHDRPSLAICHLDDDIHRQQRGYRSAHLSICSRNWRIWRRARLSGRRSC